MGNTVCTACDIRQPGLEFVHQKTFVSIEQMEQKFKKYAEDNLLGLYGRRMQLAIQKLFTLEQFHICDLLIKLSCDKRISERDAMLTDIETISLEQLDHLTLIEHVPIHIVQHFQKNSSIYYNEQLDYSGIKAIDTKNIKGKQAAEQSLKDILQSGSLVLLATVQCLDSSQVFEPLSLPTKKSPLQMFIEKVQAVNSRYHSSILVVFVVNPYYEKEFDELLLRCVKTRDLQSSRETEATLIDFKFQKIIYKPTYPCVDQQRKILIQNNRIKFELSNGDFVGFFTKNPVMEHILKRYDYIQVANINNLIEPVADRNSILYLDMHPEIQIVAHAVPDNQGSLKNQCIKLKKHFIQTIKYNPKTVKKPTYNLTHTFYLRSSLFFQKEKHRLFHKLISTRIKSEHIGHQVINFVRKVDAILYAPITVLMIVEEVNTKGTKSLQILYSNYCKKKIGLKDTDDQQLVDVCPQILHGPKQELRAVIKKLRDLPKIGFPLVVNKQKIQQFRGPA